MRNRLIAHGHAVSVVAKNVFSNGRSSTRCVQDPTVFVGSRGQVFCISTLNTRTQILNHLRTQHTAVTPQQYTSEPSIAAGSSSPLDNEVLSKARIVLHSPTIPDAGFVEETLTACEEFAKLLAEDAQSSTQVSKPEHTPASNLLSLDESPNHAVAQDVKRAHSPGLAKDPVAQLISSTAYKVITDPKVYITPKLLSTYVQVQALLQQPRSLPEVFRLYASKPVPKGKKYSIQYITPYPKKPSAHIPLSIAMNGLAAAIMIKELPLCFDIINTSVCAPAYRVSKFFRKAFVPISGAVLAPFAIYKLASELATFQSTMDSAMATQVLFAGIMAYAGLTATIGVVAVTTANDQMDRVTWATGTPLRERWMREEERMLIDRVAAAWGFQQRWRRGEEEGQDWEALREWIGMRGMVLDKTELMDGME